jgi:pimeloyl-ACP methyl ester carboxylesterase
MDVTGGLRLALREAGIGAPVVLLHGLFGHAGNFGAITRRLAERHRVLALDLRNHGASPHATPMTYPAMAADVVTTLDALGIRQVALVGHSMGGKVAMLMAQAAPERVARLCVVDIAPRAYPPAFGVYADAMAAIPLRPGLARAEADAAMARSVPQPAVRAFLLQNLRLDTDRPTWRINLAVVAAALPSISAWVPPEVPAYAGPTLFLAGERSDYITAADRPAIERRFPNARIAGVPGTGHWVHAEAGEAFLAALLPFLDG